MDDVNFDEEAFYQFNKRLNGLEALEVGGNFFHLLRSQSDIGAMTDFNNSVEKDVEDILALEHSRTRNEDIADHFRKIGRSDVLRSERKLCNSQ